jgi:hypothetical protein
MKNPTFTVVFAFFMSVSLLFAQDSPLDWKTLATEFSQDAAAAQAKYQGKMIVVTGPVSAIAAGDMTVDDPSVAVTLSTDDGPGSVVKCLFENEDQSSRTELYVPGDNSEVIQRKRDAAGNVLSSEPLIQTGQVIAVSGSFLGYQAGNIVLQHCRIFSGGQ